MRFLVAIFLAATAFGQTTVAPNTTIAPNTTLVLPGAAPLTFTAVQAVCNAACAAGTTCTIPNVTLGTGNVAVVFAILDVGGATQTITGVSTGGSFTHSTVAGNVAGGAIDASYTTSTVAAGSANAVVTISANPGGQWRACLTEISGPTQLDSGATPQANGAISAAAPVSPALTLSGSNVAVVTAIMWGGSISGASSPYNVGGVQPNGNGFAYAINITAGTGAAWTPTTANSGIAAAIAFK